MRKVVLLFFIFIFSLSTLFAQKAHKVNLTHFRQYKEDKKQSIYFADYDASRRGSVIIHDHENSLSPIRILSEPPPDAIVTFTSTLSNTLKVGDKLDMAQSLQFTQAITELTKRNTTIVVLRDALYRLNEYDFNNPGKLSDSVYLKKFDDILELASKIADKEIQEVVAEKIQNENENLKLKQEIGFKKEILIYFQITDIKLENFSDKLVNGLNQLGYNAVGSELKEISLTNNQLRYFHKDDKEKAENIANELKNLGMKEIEIKDLSNFKQLKDQFEIWITNQ